MENTLLIFFNNKFKEKQTIRENLFTYGGFMYEAEWVNQNAYARIASVRYSNHNIGHFIIELAPEPIKR